MYTTWTWTALFKTSQLQGKLAFDTSPQTVVGHDIPQSEESESYCVSHWKLGGCVTGNCIDSNTAGAQRAIANFCFCGRLTVTRKFRLLDSLPLYYTREGIPLRHRPLGMPGAGHLQVQRCTGLHGRPLQGLRVQAPTAACSWPQAGLRCNGRQQKQLPGCRSACWSHRRAGGRHKRGCKAPRAVESISTSTEQRQAPAEASKQPHPRGHYGFSAKELQDLAELPKDQFYRTGEPSTCALSCQTSCAGSLSCWHLMHFAWDPQVATGSLMVPASAVVAVAA